jgi:hypothetical protein
MEDRQHEPEVTHGTVLESQTKSGVPGPNLSLWAVLPFVATRAITIRGRSEEIWQWIAQMGYDRAGYYGYDLIENIGSKTGIRSSESIVPDLQHPKTGDVLPISKVAHMTFGQIEPSQFLIWQSEALPHDGAFTWALYPLDENHTRLVSRIRLRYHWGSLALPLDLFTEFADHVAVPKILAGVSCAGGNRNRDLDSRVCGVCHFNRVRIPLAPMVACMRSRPRGRIVTDIRSLCSCFTVDWRGFGRRNGPSDVPTFTTRVTAGLSDHNVRPLTWKKQRSVPHRFSCRCCVAGHAESHSVHTRKEYLRWNSWQSHPISVRVQPPHLHSLVPTR